MHVRRFLLATLLLSLACSLAIAGQARRLPDNGIEFVLGGDQWQPGHRFHSGHDWLALACIRKECTLEPASLAVKTETWQGHYDDQPNDGQHLSFRRQSPGPGTVLAWFHLDSRVPWLSPGPVATYATSTSGTKRPASEGTLELAVDLPDHRQATLVPLYDRKQNAFLLQLRVPGKRQILDAIASCSHVVTPTYLVWAGDIDRDGKPDFLIDLSDDVGSAHLYLAGQAGPDEIAGIAGSYEPPPFGGECDGTGWLEPGN